MAVYTAWHNPEKTLLIFRFEGKWTWEEFGAASSMIRLALDRCTRPVDLVFDMRATDHLPAGALQRANQLVTNMHPMLSGFIVFVGANAFLRAFYELFRKTNPKTGRLLMVRFVEQLEDAFAMVQE